MQDNRCKKGSVDMFLKCIRAELRKLDHSFIYPACVIIPIIPAVMGTFNYLNNTEILKSQWYSLWTQFTLFYSTFFYAPLIALYCSYIWRLEHRNNNWNVFMTAPAPVTCLYFGKLAIILFISLITQVWVGILYLIAGKSIGLSGFCPAEIIFWLFRGTLAAAAIGALQLLLSMLIKSFSVPIAVALIGGVAGMLIYNAGYGIYWPYSFILMGMNSNKSSDSLSDGGLILILMTVLFFLLFYLIGVRILKMKDIQT